MSTTDQLEKQMGGTWKYPHAVRALLDDEVETQGRSWRLADALAQDLGPEDADASASSSHANTGLFAKVEEVYLEAKKAGARELQPKTLARSYQTALAWPPQQRVPAASFGAHQALNERTDRVQRLNMLAAESSDGWVTVKQVRLWKQGLKPAPLIPFLEQVERSIRQGVNRKVADWSRLGEDDRKAIARMLRLIADEVATGEFDGRR